MAFDQSVRWSKREGSLLYHWKADKPTSMLIAHYFESVKYGDTFGELGKKIRSDPNDPRYERSLAQELDARGYDLSTFRFSIRKKAQP